MFAHHAEMPRFAQLRRGLLLTLVCIKTSDRSFKPVCVEIGTTHWFRFGHPSPSPRTDLFSKRTPRIEASQDKPAIPGLRALVCADQILSNDLTDRTATKNSGCCMVTIHLITSCLMKRCIGRLECSGNPAGMEMLATSPH